MNVRTTVTRRSDEKSDRRAHVTGRRGTAPQRRGDQRGAGSSGRAKPRRIEALDDGAQRSSAAQRAYERRQQRAALHAGDVETATLPKRRAGKLAARIPFVAAIIGMLSVGLAITLLLTTRSAEESYKLSAARDHNQQLIEEKAALQRDVESADSAPDLAAKARDLGMIPAKDPARLVVAADGGVVVVGEPKPAEGAPAPLLNGNSATRGAAPAPGRPAPSPAARAEAPVPTSAVPAPRTPAPGAPAVLAAPAPAPAPAAPAAAAPAPAPEPAPAAPAAPAAVAPAPEAATPQAANGGQASNQGEQLVPMNNSAQPPAGQQ